jgi:hypothetical protein
MATIGARRRGVPASFWVVALLLTAWGAMGVFACVQQFRLGADAMGPASDYDRALYAALPGWYNYLYALAVGSGFLAALALLMRSSVARMLFIVSLVAVALQFGWLFVTTDIIGEKGAANVVPFPLFIAAVAAFAIWYAGHSARRGWIS